MAYKKGINDLILDKMITIQGNATNKIKEITKGQAPFAAEKITNEDKLRIVNGLSPDDMGQLIQEFGPEALNQLIFEAKSFEMSRKKKLGGI